MTKVNLFLDMDGVLAEQRNDLVNYMYDKNFFLNLPPVTNMIGVAKKLTEQVYYVYILSTIIGNEYCEKEKGLWLDKHLPEMKINNRIFVPSGIEKSDFVRQNVDIGKNTVNVLIDDFTENLLTWDVVGALPIKVLNGLNNNYGTWLNNGGLYINANDEINYNVNIIKKMICMKQMELLDKAL